MSVYLDASVLVSLLTPEPFSTRADAFLRSSGASPLVSDFAAAEFASAIARRVRIREFSKDHARAVFSNFDAWTARLGSRVQTLAADLIATEGLLRRLDLTLRASDALNIAIVQRLGLVLATFDEKMAVAARTLGLSIAEL